MHARSGIPDSTGFCGHGFSGTNELKNDLGSGSGKSSEDISVIPDLVGRLGRQFKLVRHL
jgi:hypothetical protein